jgi:hypothetical protein
MGTKGLYVQVLGLFLVEGSLIGQAALLPEINEDMILSGGKGAS